MRTMQDQQQPPSTGNAFTHGFLGKPHGYVKDSPVAPTPRAARHVKGGFGANNGTIHGGLSPRHNALTLKKYRD